MTMNKNYLAPQVDILTLSQRNMLMASPPTIKVNNGSGDEQVGTTDVLSRRNNYSVWDDEEEDEEF